MSFSPDLRIPVEKIESSWQYLLRNYCLVAVIFGNYELGNLKSRNIVILFHLVSVHVK